jgi:thioredoxin-like negative regulator of GroEL
MNIINATFTTRREFKDYILANKQKLIIVKIYEDWCGPCKLIRGDIVRMFNDLKTDNKVLLELHKSENTDVCRMLGVKAVPTLVSFVNGDAELVHMGADAEELAHFFTDSYNIYGRQV